MMYKTLFCLIFCCCTSALISQPENSGLLEFNTRSIDMGEVKQGEKRQESFSFTNISQDTVHFDLVSSCECTETDWPRKPIAPGDSGEIRIVFDSTEKEESETVDIYIYLLNEHPKTGYPLEEYLSYDFTLIKEP